MIGKWITYLMIALVLPMGCQPNTDDGKAADHVSKLESDEVITQETDSVPGIPSDSPIVTDITAVPPEDIPNEEPEELSGDTSNEEVQVIPDPVEETEVTEVVVETVQVELPDHSIWSSLLKKHVSSSGSVSYKGFLRDLSLLDNYLDHLSSLDPGKDWSRHKEMAFWINVYNAFTIKLILDHYPMNSIMDIDNAWHNKFINIGGRAYSLDEIEKQMLLKNFKDPRIHFVVNCAAKSCPKLLNEAYVGSGLESQLEEQTAYFLNNRSKNRFEGKKWYLSKIFEWYFDDFGNRPGLNKLFTQHLPGINTRARISFLEYDWGLNE